MNSYALKIGDDRQLSRGLSPVKSLWGCRKMAVTGEKDRRKTQNWNRL
jgi:hypothetical protein